MNANDLPSRERQLGARAGEAIGRAMEVGFSVYASLVFVLLWTFVAAAALTDGTLLADTWAWLTGLGTIAAILVWLAILPVAVFVWAWQTQLEPLWMTLVMFGLVVWTAVAFSGFLRMAWRRGRRRAA